MSTLELFSAMVLWRDRDGNKSVASVGGHSTQEEADSEAWELARRLGYTDPLWWQWWRWFDETPDTAATARLIAECGGEPWMHGL